MIKLFRKKRQTISLIVILYAFVLASCSREIEPSKDTINSPSVSSVDLIEINSSISPLVSIYGQIKASNEVEVSLKITGNVDKNFNLPKEGSRFKKGDVLVKIDRLGVLYEILEGRSLLKATVLNSLSIIEKSFPSEYAKWQSFGNLIQRTNTVPELPKMNSIEEENLIEQKFIVSQYYAVKKLEIQAEDYFYVAPFSGTILKNHALKNGNVSVNSPVLTLVEENSLIVNAFVDIAHVDFIKENKPVFYVNIKDTLGVGDFVSLGSYNPDSSKVEVVFSIDKQNIHSYNQIVELKWEVEEHAISKIWLPKTAIQNNHVLLFTEKELLEIPIRILEEIGDSVAVEGLPERCFVVNQK